MSLQCLVAQPFTTVRSHTVKTHVLIWTDQLIMGKTHYSQTVRKLRVCATRASLPKGFPSAWTTSVWAGFWAESVEILMFPSPTGGKLTSFGFALIIGGMLPKYLWNDRSFFWSLLKSQPDMSQTQPVHLQLAVGALRSLFATNVVQTELVQTTCAYVSPETYLLNPVLVTRISVSVWDRSAFRNREQTVWITPFISTCIRGMLQSAIVISVALLSSLIVIYWSVHVFVRTANSFASVQNG